MCNKKFDQLQGQESYHEEDINNYVEVEGGKHSAHIAVVPQEDLYWNNHCSVKQQNSTCKQHPCHPKCTKAENLM
jgi:hypothetical protein